jgi:hypothetical protein
MSTMGKSSRDVVGKVKSFAYTSLSSIGFLAAISRGKIRSLLVSVRLQRGQSTDFAKWFAQSFEEKHSGGCEVSFSSDTIDERRTCRFQNLLWQKRHPHLLYMAPKDGVIPFLHMLH